MFEEVRSCGESTAVPTMTAPWVDDAHVAAVIAELEAGFDADGRDAGWDTGWDAGLDTELDAGLDAGFDPHVDTGSDTGSDTGGDARVGGDELPHVEHLAAAGTAMSPGPELASLVSWLVSPGVVLSAAGRVDVLVAVERLSRWLSAVSSDLLVRHLGAAELPNLAPADWSGLEQRGRLVDVALACEASENQVADRWALARALAAPGAPLRATGAALAAGEVGLSHARVLVECTAGLSDDDARLVQERVLGKAAGRSPARFRQICRRAVVRVDPEAAVRRHRVAAAERSVTWWPEADGMARLQVVGPAPEVMAIHGVVDLLAGSRTPGDDRTVGARRFDALLELCLAAAAPGACADDDRAVPRCGTKPGVQAQVVIDLATVLGLADHPGELRGYGPIPAGLAREWLGEATTWRRLVTDPVTGHLLDYGPVVRLAPPRLRDFVLARDGTCTFPGCGRRAAGRTVEVDHHPPWQPDGSGGSASAAQTGALCSHHHHLRTHGGWTLRTRNHGTAAWTSPTGREHRATPDPVLPH